MTELIDCLGNTVIPLEESHPELAQHFMDIVDGKLNAGVYCGYVYDYSRKHWFNFNLKPNELCGCNSERKFKKCCMGTEPDFHLQKKIRINIRSEKKIDPEMLIGLHSAAKKQKDLFGGMFSG